MQHLQIQTGMLLRIAHIATVVSQSSFPIQLRCGIPYESAAEPNLIDASDRRYRLQPCMCFHEGRCSRGDECTCSHEASKPVGGLPKSSAVAIAAVAPSPPPKSPSPTATSAAPQLSAGSPKLSARSNMSTGSLPSKRSRCVPLQAPAAKSDAEAAKVLAAEAELRAKVLEARLEAVELVRAAEPEDFK